jgi:hypothetical protein
LISLSRFNHYIFITDFWFEFRMESVTLRSKGQEIQTKSDDHLWNCPYLPPTFHTVAGSLTSDPLICLLHVPPVFHEALGEALDRLGEMLASNLILSIHIRDDWVREEGVHEPRLSIAFTMTGPPMTEAVRSMVQDAIRTTLNNPRTSHSPSPKFHATPVTMENVVPN